MLDELTKLQGPEPGQTSVVLVGVHGNEKCGVEALEKILPTLTIKRGTVFFIIGNPRALVTNVRYTETNLNRMFVEDTAIDTGAQKSYEYKRAQFLKTYLDQADVLLDIHASTVPNSKIFIICGPNAREIAKFLPADTVVSGFDNVEPGGTDYYMNQNGKIGICFECGYNVDPRSIQTAEKAILTFLKVRDHIDGNIPTYKQEYIQMFFKYFTKTEIFTLAKPFENFEVVEKNQLIGMDGDTPIRAPKQCLILFAHNVEKVSDEAFLLGEKYTNIN